MCDDAESDVIHISEIDEYLASRIVDEGVNRLSFKVEKSGDDGLISLSRIEPRDIGSEDPLDFELSPSEYLGLNDAQLDQMLRAPIVTSSALELFDFLLLRTNRFSFAAEFTGSAWKMKITEPE